MIGRSRLLAMVAIGACAIPSASFADTISLNPGIIAVGKWAEGLAFDGSSIWVAESGQRSIAQVNPAQGAVIRRVQVGRYPVGMAFANGAIYALVQTDKLVWQQFPGGAPGRQFGSLDGCPQGLAAGRQHLWVLTDLNCSDNHNRLIRLDPNTNERRAVDLPFDKAQKVAVHNGKAFVVRQRGQVLSEIDEQTLAIRNADVKDASPGVISANGALLYIGGLRGFAGTQGMVAAINPATMQEVGRRFIDQEIVAITDDARNVVGIGKEGRIYVFSTGDLQLLRTIDMPTANFRPDSDGGGPTALLLHGETLYISNFHQFGPNGAILTLNGWRPAAMPVTPAPQPMPAPAPPAPPVAGATDCPYQVAAGPDSTGIWMYQDPDTSATKVEAVPADSKGLVADRCLATWCHVSFRGKDGWVQRSHIKAVCN